MLHYYRLDLRDLFSDEDPLDPRWVLSLVSHLPTDGAFWASRRGGVQYRGWDMDRYALVALINSVRQTNYILTLVNRDPKKRPPDPPDPFPTPDDTEKKSVSRHKPGSFAAIAASMMAAQKRKRELLNGGT